jgi:MSHA biogenesis protein MshN
MSLINQLLQDLDKRRAQPVADVQLPQGTRATSVLARTRMPNPGVWLIALLGCALVAGLYLWQARLPPALEAGGLLAAVRNNPTAPERNGATPAITQAQVEATLMAPVFQLSSELTTPPKISHVALSVDSPVVTSRRKRKKREKTTMPQRSGSGSERKAVVSVPEPEPEPEPEPKPKPQIEPVQAAQQPPETTLDAASASTDDATSDEPAPRIARATKRPAVLRSEELEVIEIPAQIAVRPIARQTRQLTTYERAEIEFRKGVANLRLGRIMEAEPYFRLANEVDRSHLAARQALIGILIEAGRNADAEEVLTESLSINPRQPREAMVLARLQVERGDLDAAVRTLESVGAYAGSDAGYYSFLAAVFQRASRHEEAAKQYRNALALMPRNAIWMMGLGISLRALDESARARDAFKRAAATGTLSPELQAYVVQQYTELHLAAN